VSDLTITYRGTVYPWQCDHMGHMNVMWYTGKFDEATWQLLSKLGLTRSRCRKEGIGMAAVEQHIEYKRELRAGDLVTIRSAVLEIRNKSVRITHEMRNDDTGEVAATSIIVAVHMDVITRKGCPLPLDVRERAVLMIEEAAAGELTDAHRSLVPDDAPLIAMFAKLHATAERPVNGDCVHQDEGHADHGDEQHDPQRSLA
jgi:acyl-CoA thioester hydrolase